MQISKDELISIVDDATTTFAELLLTHCRQQVDLYESTFGHTQDASAKARLDNLEKDVEKAKERVADARAHQNRNKALHRLKQQQDKASTEKTPQNEQKGGSTVRYTDGRGRNCGSMRRTGPRSAAFFDATGRLVAHESGGNTFDASGKFAGRGNQGLRLLGQAMRR